jgi:hypothetical protein
MGLARIEPVYPLSGKPKGRLLSYCSSDRQIISFRCYLGSSVDHEITWISPKIGGL